MDYLIRKRKISDWWPMLKIVHASFPRWYTRLFYFPRKTLILDYNKQLAAFVIIVKKRDYGEIGLIATNQNYRHQGFGHLILEAGLSFLKTKNKKYCLAKVRVNNPAATKLFEGAGFKSITTIKRKRMGDVYLTKKNL